MKLCTFQNIADSKNVLQKDYTLIAEAVIKVINHIPRAGLKTKFPEKNLIF